MIFSGTVPGLYRFPNTGDKAPKPKTQNPSPRQALREGNEENGRAAGWNFPGRSSCARLWRGAGRAGQTHQNCGGVVRQNFPHEFEAAHEDRGSCSVLNSCGFCRRNILMRLPWCPLLHRLAWRFGAGSVRACSWFCAASAFLTRPSGWGPRSFSRLGSRPRRSARR